MIGGTEIWVIAGIAIIVFGAKRLPEIGKGVGEAIKNFKKSMHEPSSEDSHIQNQDTDKKDKNTD